MGFKIRTSSDNSTDKGCHSINWSFKKIKDIAPLQRGFDLPASQIIKGEYPVCYSNGIANYHNEYKVEGPGVFTGRSGTIGNVFYVKENFWPHNTTLWVTDFKNNDEKFIYYLYQQVKLERFNAGTGVPTLNRNDVHDYKVLVPTNKEEQQKIASILSTWDKAIELKEKLIEQKKEQKKGLMQKLLTGEIRLPGFGGEWKEIYLRDCIIEYKEKTTIPNQFPILTSSRNGLMLQSEYYSNRQVTTDDNVGYNIVPRNYITYRSRSDDNKFVFNKNTIIDFGIVSYFYPVFKFNDRVCTDFILELLNNTIERKAKSFVEGTAQKVLSLKKLGNFKYTVPSLEEQEAISKRLNVASKGINLLEKEVESLKQQKKGLMQLLLTGKVRVQV